MVKPRRLPKKVFSNFPVRMVLLLLLALGVTVFFTVLGPLGWISIQQARADAGGFPTPTRTLTPWPTFTPTYTAIIPYPPPFITPPYPAPLLQAATPLPARSGEIQEGPALSEDELLGTLAVEPQQVQAEQTPARSRGFTRYWPLGVFVIVLLGVGTFLVFYFMRKRKTA